MLFQDAFDFDSLHQFILTRNNSFILSVFVDMDLHLKIIIHIDIGGSHSAIVVHWTAGHQVD